MSATGVDGPPALYASIKPLHVDVDLIMVPVMVTDAMNRPVISLEKQDFAFYEEDKPQQIRYFSAEEAPISIAVLFDVSKSMGNKIDAERAAIVNFFNNANPDDEYFAITFSALFSAHAGQSDLIKWFFPLSHV